MSALLNARRKAAACALATLVAWLCAQPSRGDLASLYTAGKQRAGRIRTVLQAATRRLQGYLGTIDALLAAELRSEYETPPPNVVELIGDAHGFDDLLTGLSSSRAPAERRSVRRGA